MYSHPLVVQATFLGSAQMSREVIRPLHKILLPVDGSRGIDGVVEYVVNGARARERTEIHLLNVQPPIMTGEVTHCRTVEMIARARQAAGEEILRPMQTLLDAHAMGYTSQILLGDAARTIVRYASERGCDSIVMSTRGMSAIGNLVLGSVAAKVVRHAGVPVTLVRQTLGVRGSLTVPVCGGVRREDQTHWTGRLDGRYPTATADPAHRVPYLPECRVGSFDDACRVSRKIEALGLV